MLTSSFFAGKYVFASLVCNFRHGREEDEVMGVSFQKELIVDRVQVYPPLEEKEEKDKLQVSFPDSFLSKLDTFWEMEVFTARPEGTFYVILELVVSGY